MESRASLPGWTGEDARPPSRQSDGFRLPDRRDFPEFSQYGFRHNPIHVHHCNRFSRCARLHIGHPTAQREVGNVDFVIAEDRADFANNARNVSVAKVN